MPVAGDSRCAIDTICLVCTHEPAPLSRLAPVPPNLLTSQPLRLRSSLPLQTHAVLHLIQIANCGRFQMYDYLSYAANMRAYGQGSPPDIGAMYERLRNIPVHLVAGLRDGIIPPQCTRCHHAKMKEAGVQVGGEGKTGPAGGLQVGGQGEERQRQAAVTTNSGNSKQQYSKLCSGARQERQLARSCGNHSTVKALLRAHCMFRSAFIAPNASPVRALLVICCR